MAKGALDIPLTLSNPTTAPKGGDKCHRWPKPLLLCSQSCKVARPRLGCLHGTKSSRSQSQTHLTATPIKHVVVIFQENRSFDHYFGTYPHAKNPPGEPKFEASVDTPSVNGLNRPLLTDNPNAANPGRIDRIRSQRAP